MARPKRSQLLARKVRHVFPLRHHIEGAYSRIVSSGDTELTNTSEVERLELALANHMRASQEFGLKLRLVDMSASLNLVAVAAAVGTLKLGGSLLEALGAGLAAKLGPSLTWQKKPDTPCRALRTAVYDGRANRAGAAFRRGTRDAAVQ